MTSPQASPAVQPPTVETCPHEQPTVGIMAQEFSFYGGAQGPEGTRRTTTFYGPVIGGLPISAWHCEACGLLRLTYHDGRKEERRLYPGPQKGLIAETSPILPEHEGFGLQSHVSGLSVSDPEYAQLEAQRNGPLNAKAKASRSLPQWNVGTWVSVVGLTCVALGLLLAATLATVSVQTPDIEAPLAQVITALFGAFLLVQIGAPIVRLIVRRR